MKDKSQIKKIGKPRLLVAGCGDVAFRLLPLLRDRFRVFGVIRDTRQCNALRAIGVVPIVADLDDAASLSRLAGLANAIVHLAPPKLDTDRDQRTRNLVARLPGPATLVYVSTTGVYGDCGGNRIDETRPPAPRNARAMRRVDAERVLRAWAARPGRRLAILRVPGIYAGDRLPLERLRERTPALLPEEDVYTNHIHADDLAHIIALALFRALPSRIYNTVDDSELKMGDYFDAVADAFQLPRPPRISRAELEKTLRPTLLSFMSESRRIDNQRIKMELGVRLRYAHVQGALAKMTDDGLSQPVHSL